MTVTDNDEIAIQRFRRILFWTMIAVWLPVSYAIGVKWAETVRFRVNDLSVIPGAGLIQRDPGGVFYHVREDSRARPVYPEENASEDYGGECLDCTLVSGEQLSQTNRFCVTGVRRELPQLQFQIPCAAWAPIDEGPRALAFFVFLGPFVVWWPMRRLIAVLAAKRKRTR